MSVNHLRQVESFSGFLEFLSNPDKYKNLLIEIKKTVAEFDAATQRYASFKDAETYEKSLDSEYADKLKALEEQKKALVTAKETHFKEVKAAKETLAMQKAELNAIKDTLNIREAAVKDLEDEKKALVAKEEAFHAEQKHFKSLVDEFKKKEQALKSVLG